MNKMRMSTGLALVFSFVWSGSAYGMWERARGYGRRLGQALSPYDPLTEVQRIYHAEVSPLYQEHMDMAKKSLSEDVDQNKESFEYPKNQSRRLERKLAEAKRLENKPDYYDNLSKKADQAREDIEFWENLIKGKENLFTKVKKRENEPGYWYPMIKKRDRSNPYVINRWFQLPEAPQTVSEIGQAQKGKGRFERSKVRHFKKPFPLFQSKFQAITRTPSYRYYKFKEREREYDPYGHLMNY